MEQRQAFTTVDKGEGVVMCPSLPLLTVVYGGGGVGKGQGWHLDSLNFSFQGVAPQQRHRACLLPPKAALPTSPASLHCCMPTSQSQGTLGATSMAGLGTCSLTGEPGRG